MSRITGTAHWDRFNDESVTPRLAIRGRRVGVPLDARFGTIVARWLAHLQATNLLRTSGATDTKRQRGEPPHRRDDRGSPLRVVTARDDGTAGLASP